MSQDHFLDSSSIDQVMKVAMAIATELHATRDRLHCLEFMLEEAGMLDHGRLDQFKPSPGQEREILADRDRFVQILLAPITADPAR